MNTTSSTIEQPLIMASRDKRRAQTICYYLAFVAIGLSAGLLGPTLVGLATQTKSSFTAIGFLFTVHSFGYIIGSSFMGRLFDRVAGHKILAFMIVSLATALVLIPFAPSLWVLLCIILLLGCSEGTGQVGVNTLLVWLYDEEATPYVNGAHFCFGIGALTSPLIVAQVLTHGFGFGLAYRIVAALILPATLMFLFVPSPQIKTRTEEERQIPVKYTVVFLVALFFCLYLGSEISFGAWVSAFATSLKLSDEAKSAYLASGFWSALTLGRLFAVPLTVKIKAHFMLIGAMLLALLSLAFVWQVGNSFNHLMIAAIGLGLSFSSVYPTMFSFAGSRLNVTGRVASMFVAGGSLGAMLFPFIVGWSFEHTGPKSMITLVLAMITSALCVLLVLLNSLLRRSHS